MDGTLQFKRVAESGSDRRPRLGPVRRDGRGFPPPQVPRIGSANNKLPVVHGSRTDPVVYQYSTRSRVANHETDSLQIQ